MDVKPLQNSSLILPVSKPTIVADKEGWQTLSEETQYQDKNVRVTMQTVRTPTRQDRPVRWTVVHRKAAVVVAPRTSAGKFVLVRQERIPVRAVLWEFPAGQIDAEGAVDDAVIRATAHRELREETGYELPPEVELLALGHLFSSPGFTDEYCHLFLASGVLPSTRPVPRPTTAKGSSIAGNSPAANCTA